MKTVILAGGYGTRLSEETQYKPKALVEIGGKPILWHILKIYSSYGFNDFIICLGYKGEMIRDYFRNYTFNNNDITIDLKNDTISMCNPRNEPWKITLVDTGNDTETGGRLKKIEKYVKNETFMMTYADGIGNINIRNLVDFHNSHDKFATVTSVRPPGRYGKLITQGNKVIKFAEKKDTKNDWVSGGFFVLEPEIFSYIKNENTIFELGSLVHLAINDELTTYYHYGFWHAMDTLKDKNELNEMWSYDPPWKIWNDDK